VSLSQVVGNSNIFRYIYLVTFVSQDLD